jgi:putative redox protein
MEYPMNEADLRHGHLQWTQGMSFTGRGNTGPTITLDADGKEGPSPIVALLLACGACAGADVVSILVKMQVTLRSFSIEVTGARNSEFPKRYRTLKLTFRLAGDGLTDVNAKRAVELSVTKYCSVLLSLNPDIPIETDVVIEQ